MSAPLVLLAAGGTGGHLFPAEALAGVLKRLGMRVALATDQRAGAYSGGFPADEIAEIPAATPSGRSLPARARAALTIGRGVASSMALIRRLKPAAVVGFGGYPTVPPVLAASLLGVPAIVHEQNGVVGRANRFLVGRASLIATGFPTVKGLPDSVADRVAHVGNPVRPAVIEAAKTMYPQALKGGRFRLLVFGGSQGARVMSDVVPAAVARLPEDILRSLTIVQQARDEDLARARATYGGVSANVELQPFFKDLPQRMADAHLVIGRAGASTVAELAVVGRPSILVPLPGALDQDQAANARWLEQAGGATMILQDAFTAERLAAELVARFENPDLLTRAALAAKSAGIPDAAERLAAHVLKVAKLAPPQIQEGTTP